MSYFGTALYCQEASFPLYIRYTRFYALQFFDHHVAILHIKVKDGQKRDNPFFAISFRFWWW